MSSVTVDFTGGYTDYEILAGFVDESGHLSARVINTVLVPDVHVRIKLPVISKVTKVQFDVLQTTCFFDIKLLDSDLNEITNFPGSLPDNPEIYVPNADYVAYVECQCTHPSVYVGLDNCVVTYTEMGQVEANNRGDCDGCSETGARACEPGVGNPISMRHGEKREKVTDLRLATPAGELTFTRYYSQFSQTNFPSLLGLGWNHNHDSQLTAIPGTTNKISIRTPNGGEALFTEQFTNHYVGVAGVDSTVDWNSGTSQYTLTNVDQSTQVFDNSGYLLSRSWPNGETWTYVYSGGKLAEVNDGYGRKLVFRYYTTGSFNGQIYRVGDQTFNDTVPNNPTGRYVEYGYILNKVVDSSGAIANGTQALLTSVRDVRANAWSYEYYGQLGGETDLQQLNLLLRRKSPSVDTTGDGTVDGSLTLENVSYTLQVTELAVNGGMETDSDWTAITEAAPAINARSTAPNPVDSGTYARHVQVTSTSPANQGIEGNVWDVVAGHTYMISARVYPVSGIVKMQVTGSSAFDKPSSGTGAWETLRVIYSPLVSAAAQKLQFIASGGLAEFYVDTVSISEQVVGSIHQELGNALLATDYAFQPGGQNNTTETRAGKVTTHHFFDGVYGGTEDAAQSGKYNYQIQDSNYRPIIQSDANGHVSKLSWTSDGKQLNSVTDPLQATTSFAYNADTTLASSLDAEGRKTTYIYDGNLRQPNLIVVSKPTDPNVLNEIAVNGSMEDSCCWTNVGTPTVNQQSTTQVDSGTFSRHIVAAAAGQGIENSPLGFIHNWDWTANHTYLVVARVYPVSGVVKMQVAGTSAFDKVSSVPGAWQTLRAVYTPTSGGTNKKLQFISSGGAAEFYVDSVHILDLVNLLSVQELRYDNKGRTVLEALLDKDTAAVLQQTNRTYGSSGNENGLLTSVTQVDVVNAANNVSTNYFYDSAGRVVKTQQSSLFGSCLLSYTVYDEAGNVLATVCVNPDDSSTTTPTTVAQALAIYNATDPIKKENKVTTYEYDTLGRRVKTTINDGTSNPDKQVSLIFYDALGRVARTIANYVNQSGGSAESAGLWVWSTGNNRWEKSVSNTTAITFGSDNNQNIISDMAYNARGMVKNQRDALGNVTLFGYDDAGRLVKTIQSAFQPGYNNDYTGVAPDPTLGSYSANSAVDQDIISTQQYDAVGNLVKTVDPLGTVNYTIYDKLNRPVQTVQAAKDMATINLNPNAVDYAAANDPRSSLYVFSTDPDRDLIQTTEYDSMGRVIRSKRLLENRATEQWETTLYGYDPLGRQVKVIQKASQPAYDMSMISGDPSLASYMISSAADQDIVTQTVYDPNGRVLYTQDALGSQTWIGYDGLGRQVKTIVNAVGTATDGGVNDPRSSSYVPSSAADQDLISSTTYNSDGQVQSTQDSLNRMAYNVYDARGRVIRTITNYLVQGATNPKDWVWSSGNNRWEYGASNTTAISHGADNDQNIINDTVYDVQGRVFQTIDNRHNLTQLVYDGVGRRSKTISNYVVQGTSNPANWLWSSTNNRWEDGAGNAISFGTDKDQNRISLTTYDLVGRVVRSRDAAGLESIFCYDRLGRRQKSVTQYVIQGTSDPANWIWSTANSRWEDGAGNAISFGTDKDQNLISTTVYNKAGQVVSTTDARGTQTAFTYDKAGRRLTLTQAASHPLASTSYTCYDKAGRVLRTIQNWSNDPTKPAPDARDVYGNWSFVPAHNGAYNDRDLVTTYGFDGAGRTVQVKNPVGDESLMAYDKAGQVQWSSDPAYSVTRFFYDKAHRRQRVIQGYLPVPLNEKITYYSFPSGNYEIMTMDANGSNQVNVSSNSGQDVHPNWSPDDSKIVFASDRAGVTPSFFYDLYVMDANGSNQQRLTTLSGYAWEPVWSPDGGRIAFIFKPGDRLTNVFDLCVMNADGSNRQVLYSDPSITADRAEWSPDGQRLAFCGSADDFVTGDIYVIHADGSGLTNLTNFAGSINRNPAWLWDGSKIAFRSSRSGNQEIYVMNADGTNLVNLSQFPTADDYFPNWSPDGTRIVFYSKRDTPNREVYVMNADGSNQTRLTTNTNFNQSPAWSNKVVNPASWIWSSNRWEDGSGNPLPHGADNDRNIIVDVTYDKGGRVLTQREPLGNETAYVYDFLDRRKTLTNPLSKTWSTAYTDLPGGKSQVTMTYPIIVGSAGYQVSRDFDRLGRLQNIQYHETGTLVTPDVVMTYDDAGNRSKMSEYKSTGFTTLKRETQLTYDKVHRLKQAAFDTDGNGTIDESVIYEYDAGGLRTKLTLPGSLNVVYSYDQRGQLVSLTDWDNQKTQFAYDNLGRHVVTERANGLRSRYQFDPAGRLKVLRHSKNGGAIFPSAGGKDDFNRADSASLGANWGAYFGYPNLDVNGSQCRNPAADGTTLYAGNYYNAAQYGPDCEAYLTIAAKPSSRFLIALRVGGTLSSPNNYGFECNAGANGTHRLVRTTGGVVTALGSTFTQSLAIGDSLGISAVGSTIAAYYKASGGTWTLLATRTDSTYTTAGYLALEAKTGGWKADNFGGGTVDAAGKTLAHFEYTVDKRGNRIQALEVLANPTTATNTTIASTDKGLLLSGTWSDVGGYKENTQATASLKLLFFGSEATLSMGQGPDHSLYDVYINSTLWQSFDGYAAVAAQRDIVVTMGVDSRKLQSEGPHLLEIRNRSEKNPISTGYKLRFKQVTVAARTWTQQTIGYSYDKLSRLKEARYNPGVNAAALDADLLRRYGYVYDRAGNRKKQDVTVAGVLTTTNYTYNAANQLVSDGTNTLTYDNNGNMTSDGVNSYTWDRANRLLSMGGASYQYDGEGRRVQQTVSSTVTKYLLDIQPGLAVVLSETTGANTMRYVHSPRGIHAHKDTGGNWEWMVQDGLGSVREVVDNAVGVLESRNYDPYGNAFGTTGTNQTGFGFTGELVDGSGLLDLRARRYNAGIGVFASLDPIETPNRYSYVNGNTVNLTDPVGLCAGTPSDILTNNQNGNCWNSSFSLFRDFGVATIGVWNSAEIKSVYQAMALIALRLQQPGNTWSFLKDVSMDGLGKFRSTFVSTRFLKFARVKDYYTSENIPTPTPAPTPTPTPKVYGQTMPITDANDISLYDSWSSSSESLRVRVALHEFGHAIDTRRLPVDFRISDFISQIGSTFGGQSDCSALTGEAKTFALNIVKQSYPDADESDYCWYLKLGGYVAGNNAYQGYAFPVESGSEDLAESFAQYVGNDYLYYASGYENTDPTSANATLSILSQFMYANAEQKRFGYFESLFTQWRNNPVLPSFNCSQWLQSLGLPMDTKICAKLEGMRTDPLAVVNSLSCPHNFLV